MENKFRPIVAKDNDFVEILNIPKEKEVPKFKKKTDLRKYLINKLNIAGDLKSEKANTVLHFGIDGTKRGIKYSNRKNQNQFFADLENIIGRALCGGFIKADYKHKIKNSNILGQDVYFASFNFNGNLYAVEIKADVFKNQKSNKYSYAGHRIKEINLDAIKNSELHTENKSVNLTPSNLSITYFKQIFKNNFVEYKEENFVKKYINTILIYIKKFLVKMKNNL